MKYLTVIDDQHERPWMTSSLKRLIIKRQKAFAAGNIFLFKLLRNKVNREWKRFVEFIIRTRFVIFKIWSLRTGGEKLNSLVARNQKAQT